jgi:hypothetical protein
MLSRSRNWGIIVVVTGAGLAIAGNLLSMCKHRMMIASNAELKAGYEKKRQLDPEQMNREDYREASRDVERQFEQIYADRSFALDEFYTWQTGLLIAASSTLIFVGLIIMATGSRRSRSVSDHTQT